MMARAAALALIAVLMVGCATTHTITGSFELHDSSVITGPDCEGSGGYADIAVGTGVLVKDGDGKTLATSRLDDSASTIFGICRFTFSVEVPDAPFYAVSVGRRGELTYSRDELAARAWIVGFTLGGS
jgi:hypothetical protein